GGTGTVTCTIPTLASGAAPLFYIVVQVDPAAAQGAVISDTATVSADADPNPGNNSATTMTTVLGAPYISTDLAVSGSGPPGALAGSQVSYTINVINNGPVAASNVSVSDSIPENSTFVSVAQTSGPAFACAGAPGTRRGMRCSIDSLAAGMTATFSVVARV